MKEIIIAELFSFETVVVEIEHAVLDVDVKGVFKHLSGIGNVCCHANSQRNLDDD